ncbi:cation:dicarboxylase symporter family transporter [Novosphingobium umbonatum]|uniref:Cation:dicarboxylase symporter family transporter n=1 Tax=Novosphingobium umbonatum TaxID=1908524 RepID=A0A437MXJ7_9SPHN|nr:cation:dicarboxylase symporter family transporter [Novosphingobium umbonatum]RVU02349.1 cation:dicarboxylase symporter family transporter [Novosphingobium umbonatum]
MNRSRLILLALGAGAACGGLLRWLQWDWLNQLAGVMLPLGHLWVKALQMTLVPLVFAMVTHGVASAVRSGRGGRLISLTVVVFVAIMVPVVAMSTVLCETALHLWPLPPHALQGLLTETAPQPVPGLAAQILAIVPDNPIAAAAQGQIFPLVIFAVCFGLALARLPQEDSGADPVALRLLQQVAQAMMILVDWVLVAAPVGIFLLAMGLVQAAGMDVAQVLGMFIALCFATCLLMAALCYVVVWVSGAAPLRQFAAAVAPAQAMGAGTSSSMATMPLMLEIALEKLRLPADVVGLVIPLAVSVFRLGTVAHAVGAVLVAAHAAGIEPSPLQLVLAGGAVILGSISGAGLPGAAVIYAIYAPGIQFLGAPMAIMPLYVAVIALPDPIITGASVTGDLTAAVLVNRLLLRRKAHKAEA